MAPGVEDMRPRSPTERDPVFFDLHDPEAREVVAGRIRAHRKVERDRGIETLLKKVSLELEHENRENWTQEHHDGRWKSEAARKIARQLRDTAADSTRAELWESFECRYRELTREERKADDFEGCRDLAFRVRHQSSGCKTKIHQAFSCDVRGCPRCGPRKVQRLVEQYVDRTSAFLSVEPWKSKFGVYALTLTTKSERVQGELPAWGEMKSVLKAGSYLGRNNFSNGGRGWVFAMELGAETGMVHLHWLVMAELRRPYQPWPIQIDELNESWADACRKFNFPGVGGFGFIENVGRGHGVLRDQVAHLVKYVSKPMSFDPARFADLFLTVPSSSRWIRSGGILHSGRKPTLRQAQIVLGLRHAEKYRPPDSYDGDFDEFERALSWCKARSELASARRAEIDLVLLRPILLAHRCPDCGDELYIDFSEMLSISTLQHYGSVTMKECRPPPF